MKKSLFKFGTKAQTLKNLDGCLSKAELLPQLSFTEEEWNNNKEMVVIKVIKKFKNRRLAIRSSALCEDSFFSSMAGNFHSELHVKCNEREITTSVNRVISSYSISPDPDNEILVMPMVDNVSMSGVIFTHDLETGAPYYIIHYDDRSGKTDTITSGKRGNLKIFTYCKLFSRLPSGQDMARLIEMIKELEEIVKVDGLDIEFAIGENTLYLLQIRPIAVKNKKDDFDKGEFKKYLLEIKSFIKKNNQPFPNLHGKGTAYGIMPDWNPAEIIGIDPKPLSFSMYKELITDQIWSQSRSELGYKDVSYQPGICSLAGKPYVDIRMSFNTFLPKGLSKSLADKLVDYYILKLRTNQDFHDKVEFKIAYTCYRIDSDQVKEELLKEGFSNNEVEELNKALFCLTDNIISERVTTIENELQYTSLVEEHRALLVSSDIPPLAKVAQMVHECKRYGTLPFSKLARFAFIGTSFFKSLLGLGLISLKQYQCFFEGIPTVATDFINDLNMLKKKNIKGKDFLLKYGHLRPGTYDICSKSYAEAFEEYCDMKNLPESRRSDCSYSLDIKTMNRISKELKKHELSFNADMLLDFTRRAVQSRERAKFEFTKNVDMIFKYIIEYFKEFNISREDISYIDLKNILLLSHDAIEPDTMERMISEIQLNKKRYKVTKAIRLPPLIFMDRSVNYFTSIDALPNFVTKKTIVGDIVYLSTMNASRVDLSGKIVLVENADPGYDWIFSHKIMGLVTAFGGAASHMAIRSAEFKLPAAIGCGATLFDYLKTFTKIELNCGSKQIREIL